MVSPILLPIDDRSNYLNIFTYIARVFWKSHEQCIIKVLNLI